MIANFPLSGFSAASLQPPISLGTGGVGYFLTHQTQAPLFIHTNIPKCFYFLSLHVLCIPSVLLCSVLQIFDGVNPVHNNSCNFCKHIHFQVYTFKTVVTLNYLFMYFIFLFYEQSFPALFLCSCLYLSLTLVCNVEQFR